MFLFSWVATQIKTISIMICRDETTATGTNKEQFYCDCRCSIVQYNRGEINVIRTLLKREVKLSKSDRKITLFKLSAAYFSWVRNIHVSKILKYKLLFLICGGYKKRRLI